MSFGWSVGDVVAAFQLLNKVVLALRDSGGALFEYQDASSFLQTLSNTLQHLNALQSMSIDPDLADIFRDQCDQVRLPLDGFLHDIKPRFEPSLGVGSTRGKIIAGPKKIQWALSTSKKVKRLQERITIPMAAIGVLLGQQIV